MSKLKKRRDTMRICKFEGCGSKHYGLDYCRSHYKQFIRTGRTWKVLPGGKGHPWFGMSKEGIEKVREAVHEKNFKGGRQVDAAGYVRIHIYDKDPIKGKSVYEHRYVMEQYLGRELVRSEIVHHIDHDRENNNIYNLEVLSLSEHRQVHKRDWEMFKISGARKGTERKMWKLWTRQMAVIGGDPRSSGLSSGTSDLDIEV